MAKGRHTQVSRLFTVLRMLEGAPHGLTVHEIFTRLINDQFEVTKRSVYRDLDALCASGFPLTEEGTDDRTKRWKVNRTLKVGKNILLQPRELIALYLSKNALAPLQETPFYEDLERAFKQIENVIGSRGVEFLKELEDSIQFEPGPRFGLGTNSEVIDTIRACCDEGHVLIATYNSINSGSKRSRKLGPHFIYFAQGSIYLVAEDLEVNQVKIFSIPRMSDAKMSQEQYRGSKVDAETFFENTLGVFVGKDPVNIVLHFNKVLAPFVRERRWHSSQETIPNSDGNLTMKLSVAITPELVQWVLGFGTNVRVVEPKSLRSEITKAASLLLKMYQKAA